MTQTPLRPAPEGTHKYDAVRGAALEALLRVENGEELDVVVNHEISHREFRPIDTRFFLQLVNGCVKAKRRLDAELRFFLAKPSQVPPIKLIVILRLGLYQILFMDRVPPPAAISEAVNLAHRYTNEKLAKVVNAVLRARLREPERIQFPDKVKQPVQYLAEFYSYPDYFVEYCLAEFGFEKTEQLLTEYNRPPRVTYRVNLLSQKTEELLPILAEHKIEFTPGKFLPEFLHLHASGLPLEAELLKTGKVLVQDEGAGLCVRLLNPKPDDQILDCTAAPGGKTTYAAIRMRNKGKITALDKSNQRLEIVAENAKRLGIKIIQPMVADLSDFEGGPFDRVMLDPPCSGWGTAGKHADLRWAKRPEDIVNLSKLQARLIDKAAKFVRVGGTLVYSTCTIMRAENDQVVEEFLQRHKNFELEPAGELLPPELVSDKGYLKTYPGIPGLDGSFAARLRRTS